MKFFEVVFRRKSRNNQGRFLVYFIIVNLLAAGTVGTLLYIRTSETVKQQTEEANQNMLIQISRSTDVLLNQVEQYMDLIPNEQDIINLPKYFKVKDIVSLMQINNRMGNLVSINSNIYDLAVYYIDQDKVFEVNSGVIKFEDYIYKDILKSNMEFSPTIKMVPSFGVRRTLTKYGYPPDKQEKAIQTVMKQAENLANIWTENTTVYETNNYVEPIAAEDDGKYL